jgi:hypothetical protein
MYSSQPHPEFSALQTQDNLSEEQHSIKTQELIDKHGLPWFIRQIRLAKLTIYRCLRDNQHFSITPTYTEEIKLALLETLQVLSHGEEDEIQQSLLFIEFNYTRDLTSSI